VIIVVRHSRRTLVEKVDFITSVGFGSGPGDRERLGLSGAGPRLLITDLGILEPDPRTCELTLTKRHPGVSLEQVREATGWPLKVAPDLVTTAPPTDQELAVLRALQQTQGPDSAGTGGRTA
jgi:glutaconate CoA-transferase subunit B